MKLTQTVEAGTQVARLPNDVGVFAAHDGLARTLVDACERAGRPIPNEVGALTCGDTALLCELVYPGISHIEIPWERIGYEAGHLAQRLVEGPVPTRDMSVELSPSGVAGRDSTYRVAAESSLVQRAVALMRAHIGEPMTLDVICEELGASPRQLQRDFKRELEMTPKACWTDLRMERARRLLESRPELNVAQIAFACGFASPDRLTQNFRQKWGLTPRDFRRTMGAKRK